VEPETEDEVWKAIVGAAQPVGDYQPPRIPEIDVSPFNQLGQQVAAEREWRFWRAFLGAEPTSEGAEQ
jgi:hypothetical protein